MSTEREVAPCPRCRRIMPVTSRSRQIVGHELFASPAWNTHGTRCPGSFAVADPAQVRLEQRPGRRP